MRRAPRHLGLASAALIAGAAAAAALGDLISSRLGLPESAVLATGLALGLFGRWLVSVFNLSQPRLATTLVLVATMMAMAILFGLDLERERDLMQQQQQQIADLLRASGVEGEPAVATVSRRETLRTRVERTDTLAWLAFAGNSLLALTVAGLLTHDRARASACATCGKWRGSRILGKFDRGSRELVELIADDAAVARVSLEWLVCPLGHEEQSGALRVAAVERGRARQIMTIPLSPAQAELTQAIWRGHNHPPARSEA